MKNKFLTYAIVKVLLQKNVHKYENGETLERTGPKAGQTGSDRYFMAKSIKGRPTWQDTVHTYVRTVISCMTTRRKYDDYSTKFM